MPITPFQKEVLHLLAANRQPESHVAGGIAINRATDSPRHSTDIDFFHDVAESVFTAAEADSRALVNDGYMVHWVLRQPYLQKARIQRDGQELRLEWCFDSAFRFFPVQADPDFGYCLHPADLATNKALAMAGRSEIRDFIDILYLHETYLSLGAVCWAACGKDRGFNPASLLECSKRNMKFREEHLAGENLVRPMNLVELKKAWLKTTAEAEVLFSRLPPEEIGCLYLKPDFSPFSPDPNGPAFSTAIRHYGSLRGAWPVLS